MSKDGVTQDLSGGGLSIITLLLLLHHPWTLLLLPRHRRPSGQFDHVQSPPLSLFEISLSDVIHPLTLRLNVGSFHFGLVSRCSYLLNF
jgi:hypothetical protein